MEYILITRSGAKGIADTSQLNDEVSKKLKEGFELCGNPGLIINSGTGGAIYYQAMFKK